MSVQSAFQSRTDHAHPAAETCPYCEQAVPNDRAEEIRARFDAAQRRQMADNKAKLDSEIAAARTKIEEEKNAELQQVKLAAAVELQKQKDEANLQRQAAVEEGKSIANAALQQTIAKMASDQLEVKSKFEEAERQRLAALEEVAKSQQKIEEIVSQRTTEVRTAMEKSKVDDLNALKAQHAEESRKMNDQIAALQKRVQAEEGEGADLKLVDVLKARFPTDDFRAIAKNSGTDLVQTIKNNGKVCGRIVYDTRNRNAWNPVFATNLHTDLVSAKADHAVLTSSKFPTGTQQIVVWDGVVVCNPARVVAIAEILRLEVIRNYAQRVSAEDKDSKTTKLYAFITSDEYGKLLDSVAGNDEKLLKLEEEEKRQHDSTWKKRGGLLKASQQLHAKLRDRVDGIIGTSGTVES